MHCLSTILFSAPGLDTLLSWVIYIQTGFPRLPLMLQIQFQKRVRLPPESAVLCQKSTENAVVIETMELAYQYFERKM